MHSTWVCVEQTSLKSEGGGEMRVSEVITIIHIKLDQRLVRQTKCQLNIQTYLHTCKHTHTHTHIHVDIYAYMYTDNTIM